ncbi:MAG: GNAT family N-acetyltransferase [Myxococcaceae bacterium]|nr:GNAT family N-acetyltransferase [Myxococcaceae bacterium]MCI0670912.1 GNAT family N-acetyltransferase [Myxococcaceae bacterium]
MSTPHPTTLRLLSSVTDVRTAAWDALLDDEARPFGEWRWLAALEESGSVGPGTGWHARYLTLWRGRRLIAAAPAWLRDDSHGEYVFDATWAALASQQGVRYYPKLVLASPHTPATGRRALVAPGEDRAACERTLFGGALELARSEGLSGVHVLFPTEAETRVLAELGYRVRLGVQYHWHNRGYASWEDFLARFSARRRHQLRRERRALVAQGITLDTLRGEALSRADARVVHRLYAATYRRHGSTRVPLTEAFFSQALSGLSHSVELVVARRGRDVVGGAFNVAGPGALYGRFWGAREALPFLHFNVCLYHPVEEAIRRSLARFEPGAGGEHKLTRGFEPALTYSAHLLFHPRLDRLVGDFLDQERAAILEGLPRWRAETGLKD